MGDETSQADCCIVGGGPAGLVLALLLARRGRDVTVVDRREHLAQGGPAHAPFLSPPSLDLLQHMGLLDALEPYGQRVRQVREYDTMGGHSTLDYASVPGGSYPYALSVPLRAMAGALQDALLREPTVRIMTGTSVQGLTGEPATGYGLDLRRGDTPVRVESRFVIGSDGKFSALRDMAGIETEVFAFDRPAVMVELPLPEGTPERITAHRDHEGALVATMPVAEGKLTVLWAADPDAYRRIKESGIGALRSRLAHAVPALTDLLAANLSTWEQVIEVHHHVVRPAHWHRGNLGLLGDSAHGVHSFGAQGLNLALGDAVVLSDVLNSAAEKGFPEPLAAYEALRRPYVERFQQLQQSLAVLSSSPRQPVRDSGMYAAIAEVMTLGQPEVTPLHALVTSA
ncbi:NAD(P)/FAD-dependent oxidoreductase [Streptomyces iconiensis]|uniref:NAD(P)/FAD-dependent oxidoreductase n=1 Tax=Streptomyces iconiensis TaxID=1384038 RepID=A0ABT6ZNC1_9ACTN|nr:NAD(P)/FAD-dependent oxidoreductase [Streptomyces iconiensis]MDJ1130552.1 NAD(P)/FAD-dependent oxidoreductase [Streptomyces iconiensis]